MALYHNFKFEQVTPKSISATTDDPVDATALEQARAIVTSVRSAPIRSSKLLSIAHSFNDIPTSEATYIVPAEQLKAAYDALPDNERDALNAIHMRVKVFAEAQRNSGEATPKQVDLNMESRD